MSTRMMRASPARYHGTNYELFTCKCSEKAYLFLFRMAGINLPQSKMRSVFYQEFFCMKYRAYESFVRSM